MRHCRDHAERQIPRVLAAIYSHADFVLAVSEKRRHVKPAYLIGHMTCAKAHAI